MPSAPPAPARPRWRRQRSPIGLLGDIGTLDWTRRTNGLLGRGERARYLAGAMLEQSRAAPSLVGYRLGRGAGRQASIGEDDLVPPDSAVAREAAAECAELQPATVMEHNYRSFIYARALASRNDVAHDPELLFVATMYHDAGAMEPDLADGGRCFTLKGAADAESHLERAGWPADRRRAAAEAVTLHINPGVPVDQGAEAHLMHDGVLLDAVGLRAWEVDSEGIERVRARHPRLRFSQEGARLLKTQGEAIPGCRVATAFTAGFGLALRFGPWQD